MPSPASPQPEIATFVQGSAPKWWYDWRMRIERPGADDLVRLWPQREGKHLLIQRLIVEVLPDDLRRERGGRPGVHHVALRREARPAALAWRRRLALGRVQRQLVLIRQDRRAAGVAVPDRERHAEVALARDAPVPAQILHPLAVARPHMRRTPRDALASLQQRRLEVERAHEPLRRHDILDRRVAALMHAHRLRGRAVAPAASPPPPAPRRWLRAPRSSSSRRTRPPPRSAARRAR